MHPTNISFLVRYTCNGQELTQPIDYVDVDINVCSSDTYQGINTVECDVPSCPSCGNAHTFDVPW